MLGIMGACTVIILIFDGRFLLTKLVYKTIAAVVVLKQAPYMYKPVLHSNDLPLKKTKKLAKYSFTSFIAWILVNSLAVLLVHFKKGSTSTFWYSGYGLLKIFFHYLW